MAATAAPSPPAPSAAGEEPLGKLQRTVEISRILYRNDFFAMMRELARAPRVPDAVGGTSVAIPPDVPRRVRKMLEELGPTFIKIGQLLGTRPDLVPKPFIDEFKHLYDKTTPSPFDEVRALIEEELGRPLAEVFDEFSETPVASASVGQVHFARLKTGERVAVKVQHPGIQERVRVDFEIMEPMVRFVENLFAASRVWQPREHLLEVQQMLARELDYRNEARNVQRVYEIFQNDPSVKIPKVYWGASARRVLTLERIEGVKLSNFDSAELKALDGKRLAEIITHAMARQIFEERIFHADPSPGNLMAISSDQVAFLDWGAVGTVSRRRAERVLALVLGFVRHDIDSVSQAIIDLAKGDGDVDMGVYMRDVERIMDYHERERASVGDPVVLEMILEVANKHRMLLPPDFMLITRALFQFEGLCRKLDPGYELVDVLEPYVQAYMRREAFKMNGDGSTVMAGAYEALQTIGGIPGRLNKVLRMV
ncbi:MAG TPA: AarF/UbiB family protein, partial [Candidatus Thermoplasmatota archaeon]|nr:AarF/UbiB family protein [Candidatus Thermoplasmatota archaeon]